MAKLSASWQSVDARSPVRTISWNLIRAPQGHPESL
jgi:hypothetical protein